MSNTAETQPIPVRSLAEWGMVKRDEAVAKAEAAAEETTQMPVITLHGTEAPSKLDQLTPAKGFIHFGKKPAPVNILAIETVGVEEKLGTKAQQAAHAQANYPGYIIWYGEATQEFWVLGEELVSYATYPAMIQGLTGTVRSAG